MICGCQLRGSAKLLIGHSSFDRPADSLMHMLMHCHLPSAYDSLGRFSVEILFTLVLLHQSMIMLLKVSSHGSHT